MPAVTHESSATPAQVWSVLSNGWLFSSWVVGAARIRDVDPTWPSAGARIHHSVGAWPVLLDDETRSLESRAGYLELSARAWPFGTARIALTVEKTNGGSRLVMDEHAETPPFAWAPDEVQRLAMAPRLRECLNRLALLAENGAG
ncbi:SRPBCC family protein [uncultured Williamsia sp.]|uniref:SRPBCC family protein n=1 Tax=uncultured Williamsia sp. TaxID=259311 RepID=UPI002623D3E9|nr:SRPBCC family protein [uncultured Williamsia sp.]